jgi:hypothetical protein
MTHLTGKSLSRWPNAAHGCVVDYYGLPKHAFYTVRQSMQMLDVSLSYSDIHAAPNEPLRAMVWVDSELDTAKQQCVVEVAYFTPAGEDLGTERITADTAAAAAAAAGGGGGGAAGAGAGADDDLSFAVPAAKAVKLRQLKYKPPARLQGDVVLVRLSLLCAEAGSASAIQLATNDYTFGIAALPPPPPPPVKECTIDAGFDWNPNLPGVTSCQPSNRTVAGTQQDAPAPPAVQGGKAGPLRAMLDVANTSLSLTVVGNVMHVSAANTSSSSPCALYVKPTLRNATGHQLGYVSFSNGFQIMRPGEAAALQVVSAGVGVASHACVEAWNAPQVCAAFQL